MINFEYVQYKNLLSTGNAGTKIDLNTHKSTLILGENGAGKSTMLDAIAFGLYGKSFRKINKPQLVNSINKKGALVEVAFRTGGKRYVVIRGIKPNKFEIWQDGEVLNQDAKTSDQQDYLEENILKMDFKSFGQVVVLGSSTFVPFMQLPAGQRREIIEDLLDIQIFTEMNSITKEEISANKNAIRDVDHRIEMKKQEIVSAKKHNESIKEIKKDHLKTLKDKAKQHKQSIERSKEAIVPLEKKVERLQAKVERRKDIEADRQKVTTFFDRLSTKRHDLSKDNKFFEQYDDCPKCRQAIDEDFKKKTTQDNQSQIEVIDGNMSTLKNKIKQFDDMLQQIEQTERLLSETKLEVSRYQADIRIATISLNNIKKEALEQQRQVEAVDNNQIKELQLQLDDIKELKKSLEDKQAILSVVALMLKDGGIKTQIINQYIPMMNSLINKYLAAMDFFVDFRLDGGFNETIKSRHRDEFSYQSFSEGERLRIDLALLFTWRAVSKLRNSVSTNLLIMDEIMDSSLDDTGTTEFLNIVKSLTDDTNVFIISHKATQIDDHFDRALRFKKVKNFSVMEEI